MIVLDLFVVCGRVLVVGCVNGYANSGVRNATK